MYPVSELISRNVLDTLNSVKIPAGFQIKLVGIRPSRPEPTPADLLAVSYEGEDEIVNDGAIGRMTKRRPYGVLVWRSAGETEANGLPYDTDLNVAQAEIEKALMQDLHRGGHAILTEMRSPLKSDDPNEPPWVMVQFAVLYRHVWNDPYTMA